MKIRTSLMIFTLAVMSLTAVRSALAQGGVGRGPFAALAALRPGQWIQVEGIPQRDSVLLCTKLKMLSTQYPDSEWTVRGAIRSVDAARSEMSIGRYRIRLGHGPRYRDEEGKLKGFSDLRPGMLVKARGTYMGDGTFFATKVVDDSERLERKAGIERKIRLRGKLERVNGVKSVTVMRSTFIITERTQLRSVTE